MKNLFIALLMSIAFVGCSKDNQIDCGTVTSKTSMTNGSFYLTINGNLREVSEGVFDLYTFGDYVCVEY